jgi:hypothetical protein
MGREDELRDVLEKTAQEFKRYDSNPLTWASWVTYLLKGLEQKSLDTNPLYADMFEDMLGLVLDVIRDRLRTGGW